MTDWPILTTVTFLPAIGALLVMLIRGDDAIARRYGLPCYYFDPKTRSDWELNAIAHVTDTIRATEAALPAGARARVLVTYRENGGPERHWSFP